MKINKTQIPTHWTLVPLRELVISRKGKKPLILKKQPFENSVPYLDIEAVERNNVKEYADPYSGVIAEETDILVVWDGARSGLVLKGKSGVVGSTLVCLTPILIEQDYLVSFLQMQFSELNSSENTVGDSIPHVNSNKFFEMLVPLPPLDEQRKIVSLITQSLGAYKAAITISESKFLNNLRKELLFFNVDFKTISNFNTFEELVFKKVFLTSLPDANKAAIKNELQLIWEKTNGNIPQTLDLFFEKNINSTCSQYYRINNVLNIDDFKRIVLQQAVSGELTKDWRTTKKVWHTYFLKELFNINTGSTPSRKEPFFWKNGNIPWLKSGEIKNGFINGSQEFVTTKAVKESNLKKFPINSILIAMYGEGKTRGQVGILKIEACTNQAVAVLVNEKIKYTTTLFVFYFLLNQYENLRNKADGSVRPNLNLKIIGDIEIKVPDIEEQEEVVRVIETLFAISNKAQEQYEKNLKETNKLEKNLFEKAFKGQLVDYQLKIESVEMLLKRIKAERRNLEQKLKEFQKSTSKKLAEMKEQIKNVNGLDLEEVLKAAKEPISAKVLWQTSKYKDDIDAFYEAIKDNMKIKSTIDWDLTKKDSEVPESIVRLKD